MVAPLVSSSESLVGQGLGMSEVRAQSILAFLYLHLPFGSSASKLLVELGLSSLVND